jgi:4,5-dihydroxyphthalate decarboxylase
VTGKLNLSFASAVNERTKPLMDGTVKPEGIELTTTVSHPAETFWRQLRFGDFDVSEMSISSYLIARSGDISFDYLAIPVFPSRRFMQNELDCHADSGIRQPGDLAGKRVGVGDYQQTAALWTRAVLDHDFGVPPGSMHWYMERSPELSHAGATGFTPPPGVTIDLLPPDKSLASMLLANELDAAFVRRALRDEVTNVIERSARIPLQGSWSKISSVLGDGIEEGARFFRKYGYIPANHTYIVRGEVLRRHPWVAFNLFAAFMKAKKLAERQLLESIPLSLIFRSEYLEKTRELFGEDPFPYGVRSNARLLGDVLMYAHEQGLTQRQLQIPELFTESTLDL